MLQKHTHAYARMQIILHTYINLENTPIRKHARMYIWIYKQLNVNIDI